LIHTCSRLNGVSDFRKLRSFNNISVFVFCVRSSIFLTFVLIVKMAPISNFQVLYERYYLDHESGKMEEILLIHVCLRSHRYFKH